MRSARLALPSTLLAAGLLLAACGDAPEEASIDAAAGQVADTDGTDDAAAGTVTSLDDLEGTWEVMAGDAEAIESGTFVGYRVQEELRNVGATTAVGRTPAVTGQLVVEDGMLRSVEVVADMTQLSSDSGNRDNAIRGNGLETNDFPEATFSLTSPIEIPDGAVDGETFTVPATGELTLHGVTNEVTFDLDAQLVDGTTIVAVAQIDIVMSDYGVTPPMLGPVLSISDQGVAELQVRFTRT